MAVPSISNPVNQQKLPCYTRKEVYTHKKLDDCWIVLHGEVYNVTSWLKRHPGGIRIIMHYAGDDASVAWTSFHNNKDLSRKYMANFHIGHLVEEERKHPEVVQDFLKFRSDMEKQGMFKTDPWFFVTQFAHVIVLHFTAWWVLWNFGNNWLTWLVSVCMVVISQAQVGWLQHDFGHLSVFNSTRLNHLVHYITMGLMKGVSSFWWNYRHFQHHAKPNVFLKDPDITIPYVLLLGKRIPKIWGSRHWGKLPYHLQQHYFFLIGPPLLLPVYFHAEVLIYVYNKRLWKDFLGIMSFYSLLFVQFSPLLGGFWAALRWYFLIRFLESHWFVWCTQISHLPMHIDTDTRRDWVSMQMAGTRDVEASWFIDWFTGHLNYQIEHHFFPTMPRHNFSKVRPHIMEFCKKHGFDFQMKTFWHACADVIISLKESGQVWLDAWNIHVDPKTK